MSTRNFVPRSGSEGQLGTQAKPWGVVVADIGHFATLSGSISGSVFSTGSFGRLEIAGDSSLTGDVSIGGNINIGDADTDSLTIAADLTSNLVPNADSTFDLGSSTKYWRNQYIDSIIATGNISSSVSSTGSFGHGHIDNQLGVGTQSPDAELHVLGDGVTGAVTSTTGTNKGSIHVGGHGNDNKAMITMGNQFAATTSNPITAIGSHYSGGAGSSLFFGISTSFASGVNRIPLIIGPQAADGQVKIESSGVNIVGNLTSTGNVSGSAASTGSFGRLETAGDIQSDGRIFEQDTSVIDHATAMAIVFGG